MENTTLRYLTLIIVGGFFFYRLVRWFFRKLIEIDEKDFRAKPLKTVKRK